MMNYRIDISFIVSADTKGEALFIADQIENCVICDPRFFDNLVDLNIDDIYEEEQE